MAIWLIGMFYDSGFRKFDEVSEEENEKIDFACHNIRRFLKEQGARQVNKVYKCNHITMQSYSLHPGSQIVTLRKYHDLGIHPDFPKAPPYFSRSTGLETEVCGGEEVHDTIREILKIAPFLKPDYRDLTGGVHILEERFYKKYREN
jgi:hypothetical protein